MLRMSKLTDYSTVIMAYMARQPTAVFSVADMADAVGVPSTTASKILKALARRDLVISKRGVKGGYSLAREPELINMAEVIDAMEGPFGLTECSAEAGLCVKEAGCPMRENWQRLNATVRHALAQVTLADMKLPPARRVAETSI